MECNRCGNTPCDCVPDSQPVFRSTHRELPLGITKQEFGNDLFDAIKTASARIQCQKNVELFKKKNLPRRVKEEQAKVTQFTHELERLLGKNTIAPDDVRRILAMACMVLVVSVI